jgi:hypothetical protein
LPAKQREQGQADAPEQRLHPEGEVGIIIRSDPLASVSVLGEIELLFPDSPNHTQVRY